MLSTGNIEKDVNIKKEFASSSSLDSSHQVMAEWNYNAYITYVQIGCLLENDDTDDGYQNYTYTVGSDPETTKTDIDRIKYTPLKDIFKINRPNPGIIHGVANTKLSEPINGDGDSLSISRIFNLISEDSRVYPISKNSPFKYWSSIRIKNKTLIGISSKTEINEEYEIKNSSPFIEYNQIIYVNKIVVKTQKHQGYPTTFKVQGKVGNTWTDLYVSTKSEDLKDGVLEIYHQGSGVWSKYSAVIDAPDEKSVKSFSKSNLDPSVISISGVRFLVEKMSNPNIPVEVIEVSPRLVADISNNVTNLDINSSIGNSAYGLPIGSVVSSNGSISISDTDSYFNKNNNDSILQNILKPNVQIKIYQKLTIGDSNYRFPLKTMYSGIWEDGEDFIVSTPLEDYFKFFKEAAAPDLIIANNTGVPTSVAMLMLMDNIGFTGFRFDKTNNNNDYEDIVLDFFYSKKEQTVMEVLEDIAISTQTSIYMDVDNELVAMTKEKMISPENKKFWFVGNNGVTTKEDIYTNNNGDPETYPIGYISNIQSFRESSEAPITDINVDYNGLGIELGKKSFSLIDSNDNKKQDHLESPNFGASFINKDLRYTYDIVWQPGNDKGKSDNYLAAAALIRNLTETTPMLHFSDKTESANDKPDAIRQFYSRNDSAKNIMSINLDKEMINTFINSYSGYVLLDSELIRYNGILFFMSNPKRKTFKKKILFTKEEYNFEKSKLGQGGSIEPEALIVYLELESKIDPSSPDKNIYTLVSDGRGQNKTEITAHEGVNTNKEFMEGRSATDWQKYAVQLWGPKRAVPSTIIKALTVTNKIDNVISNKTAGSSMTSKSVPGYLKVSAAKSSGNIPSRRKVENSVKDFIPADSVAEQIVSGIFKTITVDKVNVPIRRIGTRMRLVSDVPKNVDAGQTLIKDACIAGIGWNIKTTSSSSRSGITGYFVEVEDVGKIDDQSLLSANYRNLRFYKVVFQDGKHIPKLIRNAWVNVSSTPSSAPDMGTALTDAKGGGKSYAQIFDLEVVIRDKGNKRYYEIYWDDQQIIEASETKPTTETSVAGFITRGRSSAIYEYLYVSSTPDDIVVPKLTSVATKGKDQKLSTLASRGLLPKTLMQVIDNVKVRVYFEDFGRYAREVKRFDVRFDYPSLNPKLISLANVNQNYHISDAVLSSFGSSFWLYNTSNGAIQIDESAQTPLWISAFALKSVSPGMVSSSNLIEKEEYDKKDNDIYTVNRNLYGKQELMLSGEFINNLEQAKGLAEWVTDNLSTERKSITLEIFPNPILELGDKVGLLYSDKLYNDSTKTYTVSSISHTISNSGPSMSIEIRECI